MNNNVVPFPGATRFLSYDYNQTTQLRIDSLPGCDGALHGILTIYRDQNGRMVCIGVALENASQRQLDECAAAVRDTNNFIQSHTPISTAVTPMMKAFNDTFPSKETSDIAFFLNQVGLELLDMPHSLVNINYERRPVHV